MSRKKLREKESKRVQGKQDKQKGKSKGERIEGQKALHCFQFPLINDEDADSFEQMAVVLSLYP